MAVKQTRTCDLCGHEQPGDAPMASLVVPFYPTDSRSVKPGAEPSDFVSILMYGSSRGRAEVRYDVCLGCVTGLLNVSLAEKRAIDPEVVR